MRLGLALALAFALASVRFQMATIDSTLLIVLLAVLVRIVHTHTVCAVHALTRLNQNQNH